MNTKQTVQVEGKPVQLTNLNKVLWPKLGLTKADLLDYHVKLYTYTREHWRGRALTVTRYPHGVDGDFFYQKNLPPSAPPWVSTTTMGETDFVVADGLATIIWLANSGVIEFHPSTFLVARPEIPSYAIIDLDPTEPQGFREAVEIAKYCRELLEQLGLEGYPKLSGATGIHIYVPLEPSYDFEISSELVRLIGMTLRKRYPDKITLERMIKNRHGVYVDYLQNHPSRTIVGVYSPRPTPDATVSTPVSWQDLGHFEPRDFTIRTVPDWIRERGDLFSGVLWKSQSLQQLIFSNSRP